MRRTLLLVVVGCLLAVGFPFVSFADTLDVPGEYPTIQAAVDAASDGDSILIAAGEYTESTLISSKILTILGEGVDSTIINALQEDYIVFGIRDTSTVELKNMTLQNGGSGVSVIRSSRAMLSDLIVTDLSSRGIGVKVESDCAAELRRVQILNHGEAGIETSVPIIVEEVKISGGQEGLVIQSEGSVDVRSPGLLVSQEMVAGVRIWAGFGSEFSLKNLTLTKNFGPALLARADVKLTLIDSKVIDNFGSGIVVETEEEMSVSGCDIYGNSRYDVEVLPGELVRVLDFQHNWWGEATTVEMNQVGFPGNISTIWDWNDDPLLSVVDFSNWENPVGVRGGTPPVVSNQLMLYQNFPNPFNPSTRIRFDVGQTTHVRLALYNVGGQWISNLLDSDDVSSGEHVVSVDLPNLASGVYFYRLETSQGVESRKMMLLK